MRLAKVRVNNYRSIQSAESFQLGDLTVLVGPNNEGKSNLLRATVLGAELIKGFAKLDLRIPDNTRRFPLSMLSIFWSPRTRDMPDYRPARESPYLWERDYPISLQTKQPNGRTSIRLEFSLTKDENEEFRKLTDVRLNQTLTVRWSIGNKSAELDVLKRGPGKEKLRTTIRNVSQFISDRIDFHSILAIRTHSRAQEVVRSLVHSELRLLEEDPEYRVALDKIRALRQPVLDNVEHSLLSALQDFLPNIQKVEIRASDERSFLRPDDVLIDDGVMTSLRDKGDGVQSLAALSLMQHLAMQRSSAGTMVLAIEEPEAHLHPDAVHALRATLKKVAEEQQVIVTTHNPIFVNRAHIASNIIVQKNNATPAKKMSEVRLALGVRVYDNLASAELVILVEGDTDEMALKAIFSASSIEIDQAIREGRLVFTPIGGATKLAFNLTHLANQICGVYVILDNDEAARAAVELCMARDLLEVKDVTLLTAPGRKNSELEDLIRTELYAEMLRNAYGVAPSRNFRIRKSKWSDRMEGEFVASGKPWFDDTKQKLKGEIAALVASEPGAALQPHCTEVITQARNAVMERLRR